MRVAPRLLASMVFGTFLLAGAPAHAETIHAPADGVSTQEDQGIAFDWAWSSGQYASRILFTQDPNPAADVWYGSFAKPGKVVVSDAGYSFTSSNAYVVPKKWSITPGQWYWRLCNYTIDGEDDKCYFDPGIVHPFAVTAAPAPAPAPTPAPALAPTPTVAAPTTPAAPTPTPPRVPAKPYSRTAAVKNAKLAINAEFSYKKTPAKRRITCAAATSGVNRCTASWETSRYRYRGTVRMAPNPFTASDIAAAKKDPAKLDDSDYWYTMKLTRTTKRTKSKKTITLG